MVALFRIIRILCATVFTVDVLGGKGLSCINGGQVTFPEVLERFQPTPSLAMGKACCKKWTQLLSQDTVNDDSQVSITGNVFNVIEALGIALNRGLVAFVIRTQQG